MGPTLGSDAIRGAALGPEAVCVPLACPVASRVPPTSAGLGRAGSRTSESGWVMEEEGRQGVLISGCAGSFFTASANEIGGTCASRARGSSPVSPGFVASETAAATVADLPLGAAPSLRASLLSRPGAMGAEGVFSLPGTFAGLATEIGARAAGGSGGGPPQPAPITSPTDGKTSHIARVFMQTVFLP
jgi:hypothetical protein